MKFRLLFFFLLGFTEVVNATDYASVAIGIMQPSKPRVVQIKIESGTYHLVANGEDKLQLKPGDRVIFSWFESRVKVSRGEATIGRFTSVYLKSEGNKGVFRLFVLSTLRDERVYDDNLEVSIHNNFLKLINRVELEKYIAGVVEAETGKDKGLEFYKVQAIISRSYALNNLRKNWRDGYNLNDQVDCQVYHGKCRWVPEILEAVRQTRGLVLVDSEMQLITAAFHSNSGGETVGSESVWSGALPYLTPRLDEFSRFGEHASWSDTVATATWLSYFKKYYKLPVEDKTIRKLAENFEQENREVFFIDPIFNIPLKQVRKDWNFNSTYFDVIPIDKDSLLIRGRGFGHGAGLSQEGAMRMADLGFTFSDILHFYYNDVHIIDLKALDFFRTD